MYENEFTGALQAMSESMSEEMFDSIIEGASALIEETGMTMDEAVDTSAAALFTEDMIDENAFAITYAIMDEFANNRQVSWDEALSVIAESVDVDTFDELMVEGVSDMIAKLKAKGAVAKEYAKTKGGQIKAAAKEGSKYAKAAGQTAVKAVKGSKPYQAIIKQKNRNDADDAAAAAAEEKAAARAAAKEAARQKIAAAKEMLKSKAAKNGEPVEEPATEVTEAEPANESVMTLGRLRAIVESASDPT